MASTQVPAGVEAIDRQGLVGEHAGETARGVVQHPHNLVTGESSTATQVIAVAVLIDFLLIIPFAFLELRRRPPRHGSRTPRTGC
jgi:hypothetical protein